MKTNDILANTNIVVDYTHPDQTGFTMRTIESIGHRCKLITNNKQVLNSDFYNENNVFVYDSNNFYVPNNFLNSNYSSLSEDVYKIYSVGNWIKEILDLC